MQRLKSGDGRIQEESSRAVWYNSLMIKLAVATPAGEPRSKDISKIGWLVAVIILFVAASQVAFLISGGAQLPDPLIATLLPSGMEAVDRVLVSRILSGVLVFLELQAIPFILGLKVSPALRIVSMWSGWLVALSFIVIVAGNALAPGTAVIMLLREFPVNVDGLLVCYTVIFAVLVAVISWNRWPKDDLDLRKMFSEQKRLRMMKKPNIKKGKR